MLGFVRVAFGLVLLLLASPLAAAELRIVVNGVGAASGTMMIGLYDTRQSFDNAIALADKEGLMNDPSRVAGVALRATAQRGSSASVVFSNLPPGRYAVILFHDENGNGHLDKNFWGVPVEPYGFSNDAQGLLGPPSFAEAAFTLDNRERTLPISLVRHLSVAGSPPATYNAEE